MNYLFSSPPSSFSLSSTIKNPLNVTRHASQITPRDSQFHLNPSSLIQTVTLLCMRRLKALLKVL